MDLLFIFLLLAAYLIGSFPVGYIIAKMRGINDIRKHGSGNIGATNVSRVLGFHYFFIIFLLDAGKAFTYLYYIGQKIALYELYFCAVVLLLGNCYSIFLKGTGGKGVATVFGILLAIRPLAACIFFAIWVGNFLNTRNAGISSVVSIISVLGFAAISLDLSFFIWSLFAVCLVIWTHRTNLMAYRAFST